jgi:hypothetical protein
MRYVYTDTARTATGYGASARFLSCSLRSLEEFRAPLRRRRKPGDHLEPSATRQRVITPDEASKPGSKHCGQRVRRYREARLVP